MKAVESSEQALLEVREEPEKPVVRGPFAGFFPDILGRIELGRVLGEEVDLDEVLDLLQPLPNPFCLVPWSVVHNQMNLSPLVVPEELFDKGQERVGIVSLNKSEMPSRLFANPHRSHDFHALATRKTPDPGPFSPSRPGAVQRAGLAEGSLVLIDQDAALLLDFFFRSASS